MWKFLKRLLWLVLLAVVFFIINILFFVKDPIQFSESQKSYIWERSSETEWKEIALTISDNWYLQYIKKTSNTETTISWPIIYLDDEKVKVWLGVITSSYDIAPPEETEQWLQIRMEWEFLSKIAWVWVWNKLEKLPSRDVIDKTLAKTFAGMKTGIENKSFDSFEPLTAKLFQKQIGTDGLAPFIWLDEQLKTDLWVPLTDLFGWEYYLYADPYLWPKGELYVLWSFVAVEWLYFRVSYVYESPEWKMLWINVKSEKF